MDDLARRHQQIQAELAQIGIALPGSLTSRTTRCLATFAVSTAGRVGVVNGVCRGDSAGSRDAGRWTASPWP
jgi:hypothetical protein